MSTLKGTMSESAMFVGGFVCLVQKHFRPAFILITLELHLQIYGTVGYYIVTSSCMIPCPRSLNPGQPSRDPSRPQCLRLPIWPSRSEPATSVGVSRIPVGICTYRRSVQCLCALVSCRNLSECVSSRKNMRSPPRRLIRAEETTFLVPKMMFEYRYHR
jgi:hypothetical protein